MTKEEWDALALMVEHGFKGDFPDTTSDVYFLLLRHLERSRVEAALTWLLRHGSPFVPAAAEIVQAAGRVGQPSRPTWTEVWPVLRRAMRHDDEGRGLAELADVAGPYAAAFAATWGWRALRMLPLCDPDYGELSVRRLGEEYDRWLARVAERMRDGLSLEEATPTARLGGLRRPDFGVPALGSGGKSERTIFGFTEDEAERIRMADDKRRALSDA